MIPAGRKKGTMFATKKLLAILLIAIMPIALSAQTDLKTLSAYANQAHNFYVLQLPNPDGAWNFTSISVSAGVPATGDAFCGVRVYVVDWWDGSFSTPAFLGAGGWSTNQTITFQIPKNDNVGIWISAAGNCTAPAKEINIAAQYSVS
jgi:hypothetical protein